MSATLRYGHDADMDIAKAAADRLLELVSDKLESDPLRVAAEAAASLLDVAPKDATTAALLQHVRSALPSSSSMFEVATTLGMTLTLRAVREVPAAH